MTAEKTVQDAAADLLTMGISWQTVAKLAEPTPEDQIKQRQGNRQHQGDCQKQYGVCQLPHKMLDYVTARYVMDRLDSVCGPYWARDHRMEGTKVSCGIGILIDGVWVWRWDGAGETDIEGEKGSFSDSFKRAGANWAIARDLYPDAATHQAAPSSRPAQTDAGRVPPSTRPAAVPADYDSDNELGMCPVHQKSFRPGNRGRPAFCPTKVGDGWCQEHP